MNNNSEINNNLYVTGYAGGGSTGSSDSYNDITTIKYNPLGDTLWKKTFIGPGTSSDEGSKITLDDVGNVYVTGKSYYGVSNGFDIITIKYDSIGTELWAKNFNGSDNGNDISEAITLDDNGNIYVLGTTVNTTSNEDYQIIKYNASGTQLWENRYTNSNGSGNQEYAVSIFVDEWDNIYAAGMSILDYAIVKYSQTTGVEEVQGQFTVTISPNPSNGNFFIENKK